MDTDRPPRAVRADRAGRSGRPGAAARVAGAVLLAGALLVAACTPVGGPPAGTPAPATPSSGGPPAAGEASTAPAPGVPAPSAPAARPTVPPPGTLASPDSLPPPAARPAAAKSAKAPPRPRRGQPIPEAPVSIDARCSQTEKDGYREDARLHAVDGDVKLMAWNLWVGSKGYCGFVAEQFRQVKSRPHAELLALDGSGCKLMVWQTPDRVTLAHAGCAKYCVGDVYEQAWPVMFDLARGGCASGAR